MDIEAHPTSQREEQGRCLIEEGDDGNTVVSL